MSQLNFIFGLGIFLFGMSQLENGLLKLSDARLRHWLRSSTGTSLGSVSTGVVSTALLQSSSMVSLLVLAFASAGLLPLLNAIGIILGANLGTTFTGWLVATIGFKLDLEAIALPLLGLSCLSLALIPSSSRIKHAATVVLGIGLLLFGMGLMKDAMEAISNDWDIAFLQARHPIFYLIFGVVLAFLVQSSSAVMMMALTALNAGLINLPEAAALVIGADLGTTSTTILGSLSGSPIKRQLAFAHCMFNVVVDLSAFLFLLPLLPALLGILRISDPLYSLVAFHSVMNLLGLMVFIPFIKNFSAWIERVTGGDSIKTTGQLDLVEPTVADAALTVLREAATNLVIQGACNAMRLFALQPEKLKLLSTTESLPKSALSHQNFKQGYEALKQQEGDILRYSLKVQESSLSPDQVLEIEQLRAITRTTVYGNKTLKDIEQDLQQLKQDDKNLVSELYKLQQQYHRESYTKVLDLVLSEHPTDYCVEEIAELRLANDAHFDEVNEYVLGNVREANNDTALSTQLNVNREVHHALKGVVNSVQLLRGRE